MDTLTRIALHHGTDKWGSHFYTQTYDRFLSHLRSRPIRLLEIGIGGCDNPYEGGESLRMWREYFPSGLIFGLDIYDKSPQDSDRIHTILGSQNDRDLLARLSREYGPFDVIIDDGSHLKSDIIVSMETLFPLMPETGIYSIEDMQTAYWSVTEGSDNLLDPETTMGYLVQLAHGLNYREIQLNKPEYEPHPLAKLASDVSFHHNMCLLTRGDNSEPSNFNVGANHDFMLDALATLDRETSDRRSDPEVMYNRACMLMQLGRRSEAIAIQEQAALLGVDGWRSFARLGGIRAEATEWHGAAMAYRAAAARTTEPSFYLARAAQCDEEVAALLAARADHSPADAPSGQATPNHNDVSKESSGRMITPPFASRPAFSELPLSLFDFGAGQGLGDREEAVFRSFALSIDERGEGTSLWSTYADMQAPIIEIIRSGSDEARAEFYSRIYATHLTHGFLQGQLVHDSLIADERARLHVGSLIIDRLYRLAEAVGALPVMSGEHGQHVRTIGDLDAVFAAIEQAIGVDLSPPQQNGRLFGLKLSKGVYSDRHFDGIYGAWRARTIMEASGTRAGAMLEIGGGGGHLAYYARKLGFQRTAIIDLPQAIIAQYFMLASEFGADVVKINEQSAFGVDLMTSEHDLASSFEGFDIVVNVDSFPEMPRNVAARYVNMMPAGVHLLSVNQESQVANGEGVQNRVKDLATASGLVTLARFPAWLRTGYVEELFVLPK